jgi:hypothetical protein
MMAGGADLEVLKHELKEAAQEGGTDADAYAETADEIEAELIEMGKTPEEQGEP